MTVGARDRFLDQLAVAGLTGSVDLESQKRIRAEARSHVGRFTGAHPYTIDQVLQDLIERCRELRLRMAVPARHARTQAMILLTVHTMNLIRGHRYEVPV